MSIVRSAWVEHVNGSTGEIVSRRYDFTTCGEFARFEIIAHSDEQPDDEGPERIMSLGMTRRDLEALRHAIGMALEDME